MGVVIFGTGTLAQVVARYYDDDCENEVVAYTVDADYIRTLELDGRPVVPFEELAENYPPEACSLLVAVTQQNGHRDLLERKVCEAWEKGYCTTSFIHPSATVANFTSGGNYCVISPGAIIEPYITLGNGVFIRSGAYVGHHCTIRDFAYIAPRASVSGHVDVGAGAFIGNNATIRDRVTIGHHAVIGCGAAVLRDVKPYEVYRGYPARLLSISGNEVEI